MTTRESLFDSLMTVAVAPGTTALCGSTTVPEIDPVAVCAADPRGTRSTAARHTRSKRKTLVFDITGLLRTPDDGRPAPERRRAAIPEVVRPYAGRAARSSETVKGLLFCRFSGVDGVVPNSLAFAIAARYGRVLPQSFRSRGPVIIRERSLGCAQPWTSGIEKVRHDPTAICTRVGPPIVAKRIDARQSFRRRQGSAACSRLRPRCRRRGCAQRSIDDAEGER